MSSAATRWAGVCRGCGRDRDLETRYEHGAKALCDECAARPPRAPVPPRAHDDQGATVSDEPSRRRDAGGRELRARRADLSAARPPRWAWDGRVAAGYLNLVLGGEGVGKGTLLAWASARWTRGQLPGDLHGRPCNVAIIGDEDSFTDVWTPRLHVAGADLDRVLDITVEGGHSLIVGEDHEQLAGLVHDEGVRVLVLDQLLDNLGAIDDWRSKPVRDALAPLRRIARDHGIAVVVALHPNKRGDSFRQLVSGSVAFNALSRSSLLLAEHPDDEDCRVLVRGKGNLAKRPAALEFEITTSEFANEHGAFKLPAVTGMQPSSLTVDELIAAQRNADRPRTRTTDAEQLLRDALPADGSPRRAAEILKLGEDLGLPARTVQRATETDRIRKGRDGFGGPVTWAWARANDANGAYGSTSGHREDADGAYVAPMGSDGGGIGAVGAIDATDRTLPRTGAREGPASTSPYDPYSDAA